MKSAFCTKWIADTQEEMEKAIPALAEMGYDGLEFWEQYLSGADLRWLKDTMDSEGLEIVQICPYFDFTTSSETWGQSLRDAERFIGYSLELGRPFVRTYTGNTGSADATEEQWDACVKGLRRVCEMGRPHGIVFPLETHQAIHGGPNLTDTSATTLRLLEDVGMDNLKVNLQTPLLGESVVYSARELDQHIVHLHAHNWIGNIGSRTFLDSGDVDFAGFIRVLKDNGFDGYISIEHGDHHPPYETAAHEARYLKCLIAGEFWR